MITDKNGNEVTLDNILHYLTGTDENDEAKSVIDFALYDINEKRELEDPKYYLIATGAIVTQISFVGPFVMLEVDFRNIGIQLLNQVMAAISQFHNDINTDDILMLSTITPMEREAPHILSLANPLVCVRGYSEAGQASTILQLVYSVDNAGFVLNTIDYDRVDAEIERELHEIDSYEVTNEAVAAAQAEMEEQNEENEEMKNMFAPQFGSVSLRNSEDKFKKPGTVRVAGTQNTKLKGSESVRIEAEKSTRLHGKTEEEE